MINRSFIVLSALLMSCAAGKKTINGTTVKRLQYLADSVRMHYAPDRRTALFQVTVTGNILSGETNIPEAKAALLASLNQSGFPFVDSVQLLPEAGLQGRTLAVVNISVANLRAQNRHPAELVTQATLGTPLNVWKKDKGWYLVQTPDHYLAWVDGGAIRLMDNNGLAKWKQGQKLIYTKLSGLAFAAADMEGATVSDLVYGDVMVLRDRKQGFYEVEFPDGRSAFIPESEAILLRDWTSSRQPTEDHLVAAARRLMGVPYLWGGTSFKGVDCSGFTRTVYFMNGLVLPRDASQQVNLGVEIDTTNGWRNLRPGDLLFFGIPAQEGKAERVVHVGMWIGGNQEFIQSSGRVQISSMNPQAENYDENEHKRFLRAKRITPQEALYDLRTATYF